MPLHLHEFFPVRNYNMLLPLLLVKVAPDMVAMTDGKRAPVGVAFLLFKQIMWASSTPKLVRVHQRARPCSDAVVARFRARRPRRPGGQHAVDWARVRVA